MTVVETMDPDQIPPPSANITFPPNHGDQLDFNYLDSFVTSWVTPQFAQTPCHISLYFWISDKDGWHSVWNKTALLNETRIIPLNYLKAPGLGQVNLDYHNPDGSHLTVTGALFSAIHDPNPIAPKSIITWNRDALTETSTIASTRQPTSSATAAPTAMATSPSIAASTAMATSAWAKSPPTPAHAIQAPTSSSSVAGTSNTSPSVISTIVLGSALGLLTMILLAMAWFRWRRNRQKVKSTVLDHRKQFAVKPEASYLGMLSEKDARNAPTELLADRGGLELSTDGRFELPTTRWKHVSAAMPPARISK